MNIDITTDDGIEKEPLTIDEQLIAYNGKGEVYTVYQTEKSHVFNSCLGKIRCIFSKNKEDILATFMPLTTCANGYTLVSKESLKHYHELYLNIKK
jgi:hypothetical protein